VTRGVGSAGPGEGERRGRAKKKARGKRSLKNDDLKKRSGRKAGNRELERAVLLQSERALMRRKKKGCARRNL